MTALMSIIPAPMKKPYGHMMTSAMKVLPKVPTTSYLMTTDLRLTLVTYHQILILKLQKIETPTLMTPFLKIMMAMDHMTLLKAWMTTILMSLYLMI